MLIVIRPKMVAVLPVVSNHLATHRLYLRSSVSRNNIFHTKTGFSQIMGIFGAVYFTWLMPVISPNQVYKKAKKMSPEFWKGVECFLILKFRGGYKIENWPGWKRKIQSTAI
jgi:hypothetical protein